MEIVSAVTTVCLCVRVFICTIATVMLGGSLKNDTVRQGINFKMHGCNETGYNIIFFKIWTILTHIAENQKLGGCHINAT